MEVEADKDNCMKKEKLPLALLIKHSKTQTTSFEIFMIRSGRFDLHGTWILMEVWFRCRFPFFSWVMAVGEPAVNLEGCRV